MALIQLHPDVSNPIVEFSLGDIQSRGGVADIFEQGRLILIKDYRLPVDFGALSALNKSTETVSDPELRRRLKKLTSPYFFGGAPPVERDGRLIFADATRQAVFDVLCGGDAARFHRAAQALHTAHEEALRIFEICFPGYETSRFIPSIRVTRTLFENLHWDNHSIDDDFHQARIFANLDDRPRIWNVSHGFTDWMKKFYKKHDLGRFAGQDPNRLIDYITGEVLGGTLNTWMDREPRHRIAFDPGEVWLGESRLISHQIVYGESAMVYMWFVKPASMFNPEKRFNAQVDAMHQRMQAKLAAAA